LLGHKAQKQQFSFETDFNVSSAFGAGNIKIGFLKAHLRWAFKKPILIMRIASPKDKWRSKAPPFIFWTFKCIRTFEK
jgi:hypothetical protein